MNDQTLIADKLMDLSTHIPGFNIRDYTAAPLRIRADYQFDVLPELLFQRLTDPELIAGWFAMIKSGSTDHSQSENRGHWGAGSKRYCKAGAMGTMDETIYYWDEPHVVAYNIKAWSMPVKDHCAVMYLQALSKQETQLTWLQYFNYKGMIMRHLMPKMMVGMISEGLESLRSEVGGKGGKVTTV